MGMDVKAMNYFSSLITFLSSSYCKPSLIFWGLFSLSDLKTNKAPFAWALLCDISSSNNVFGKIL